jgi:hypothetical protein
MYKNIAKTESVTEFLARGGKIKTVAAKGPKKTRTRQLSAEANLPVDWSALPEALKIRFGVR